MWGGSGKRRDPASRTLLRYTVAQLEIVIFINARSATSLADLQSSSYHINFVIRGLDVARSRM